MPHFDAKAHDAFSLPVLRPRDGLILVGVVWTELSRRPAEVVPAEAGDAA